MSEPSRAPNIFPVPATWNNNPLRATYDQDVPKNPNKEFDSLCHLDVPAVTQPAFSVLERLDWNLARFDIGRIRRMQTDGNEWQLWEGLGKCRDTVVAGWPRPWSNWWCRVVPRCHCGDK